MNNTLPCAPVRAPSAVHVSIAGSTYLQPLVDGLIDAFTRWRPDVSACCNLQGASVALPRLIHGRATLSIQGRAISDEESVPFLKGLGGPPIAIAIAHAGSGLTAAGDSGSLGLYVHSSNPLTYLSLRQAACIFSTGHPFGELRQWGQVGLQDRPWATRPVQALVREQDSPLGTFLRRRLFDGHALAPTCVYLRAPNSLLERVAVEPAAIAFAPLAARHMFGKVKRVATDCGSGDPSELDPECADLDTRITAGRYPLAAQLLAYYRPDDDGAMDPAAHAFFDFTLSAVGQALIACVQPGCLPLDAATLQQSRRLVAGATMRSILARPSI